MAIPIAHKGKINEMSRIPSYFFFRFNNHYQEQVQTPTISMRVQPSNFSGPDHLRALYGKCFTKLDDS